MTQNPLALVRKTALDLAAENAKKADDREAAYKSALTERDYAIFEAHEQGASAIKLAELTGLTRQRVHKIVAELSQERYGWTLDD